MSGFKAGLFEHEIVSRREEYDRLVSARKACRLCTGLVNPSQLLGGALDCEDIGAWSRWQGSLLAETVVVGQDFADEGTFQAALGRHSLTSHTNKKLKEYLNFLGYALDHGDRGRPNRLFFTNAVLCLKPREKGMQGNVDQDHAAHCGLRFLRPLLGILKPALVIALGQHALTAVCKAHGLSHHRLNTATNLCEGIKLPDGSRLFAVYHPNMRTANQHRSQALQKADWARIKKYLKSKGRNS